MRLPHLKGSTGALCSLGAGGGCRVRGGGLGGGTCQGEAHPPGPPTALIQGLSTAIPWVRWTRLEGDVLTLTSWAEVAAEAVQLILVRFARALTGHHGHLQ